MDKTVANYQILMEDAVATRKAHSSLFVGDMECYERRIRHDNQAAVDL